MTRSELRMPIHKASGHEGELAHLSKPARMLIYFLMFFLGCVYWIAFLWFATDEANFY